MSVTDIVVKFFCYGHQCQKKSAQEKPQKLGKDVMVTNKRFGFVS